MNYVAHMNFPPSSRERLAAEVLAEMARQRITRAALARDADITYITLQRRLAGKSPFTYDELAAIAEQLGVGAADLVARADGVA